MKDLTKNKPGRPTPTYKVALRVLGSVRESQGKTLEQALENLNLDWPEIKGKGVLTVKKGAKSHEQLFAMQVLRRIASNKIVRVHWAKNLAYLLNEK